jgi:hypothetical protein
MRTAYGVLTVIVMILIWATLIAGATNVIGQDYPI